jgi:dimethylargininase
MLLAITRTVSPAIEQCEVTFAAPGPIDHQRASSQHSAYESALRNAGCAIEHLPAVDHHPDGVFVEDTALVLDEIAVITRPGAISRRGEVESVASLLARYRPIARIVSPGTLDGGDVLVSGKLVYVGCSGRSNADGIRQLEAIIAPLGYQLDTVAIQDCLHLKSAATLIGDRLILADPSRVDATAFSGHEIIQVAEGEGDAANALRIGDLVLLSAAGQRTRERLAARGLKTTTVANDELAKADGGLTCCSLLLKLDPETER